MISKDEYRKFQSVLTITEGKVETRTPHKLYKRSVFGCIRCKEKKIKCDEVKPRCLKCQKSRLKCVWPDHITKSKPLLRTTKPLDNIGKLEKSPKLSIFEGIEQNQAHEKSSVMFEAKNIFPLYGCLNNSSEQDLLFSTFFLKKFFPSMARLYFNEEYFPLALLLERRNSVAILDDLFQACGASMLAYENSQFVEVARNKYNRALCQFIRRIKEGYLKGNEDWLLLAVQILQVLSLRNPNIGPNAAQCAFHFSATYTIIKKRLCSYPYLPIGVTNSEISSDIDKFTTGRSSQAESEYWSPLDDFMTENFIFNFSLTILLRKHDSLAKLIPNPFEVFELYKSRNLQALKHNRISSSIYECSSISFELAAKSTWILRLWLPLNNSQMKIAEQLLLEAEDNLQLLCAFQNLESWEYKRTISLAKIVTLPCIIILRKIVSPMSLNATDFQYYIDMIIVEVNQQFNDQSILPVWSLMIAAIASVTSDRRNFLFSKIISLNSKINSNIMLQIMNYLEGIWEIYRDSDVPFELLFDTNALDLICS